MLKLVVSDLDGTLIFGNEELTPEFYNMTEVLNRKNILFAVASGRKLCELKRIFNKVKNDVIFIACDGAYAVCNGEIVASEAIDKAILEKYLGNINYEEIKDSTGEVFKIVVRNADSSPRMEEAVRINRALSLVYDDNGIKEYVKYGVNKATALKKLLFFLNIKKEEVVVFGDNLNDAEMLKLIPKSYAMETGKNEIKRICRYTTDNVCSTIIKLAEEE